MKGNAINGLVAVLLAIVLGVSMLPIVGSAVANYDVRDTEQTFTAIETDTVAETFTLTNEPESILGITVTGTELAEADYSVINSDVELVANASTTDDEVIISYDYSYDAGTAVDSMINLLPLIFVIVMIGGAVAYIRFK